MAYPFQELANENHPPDSPPWEFYVYVIFAYVSSRPLVPGLQAITKFVTELPPERLEDLQNLFRVQDWYLDFVALLRLSNTELTLHAPTTKRM